MFRKLNLFEADGIAERQLFDVCSGVDQGANLAVVGLTGSGRSKLLNSLFVDARCKENYFSASTSVTCLMVDSQNLVEPTVCGFNQLVLRTMVEQANLIEAPTIGSVHANTAQRHLLTDPFFVQSEIRRIVKGLQAQGRRLVLILDQFDDAAGEASAEILTALVGLRSGVEDALSYVIGLSADIFNAVVPNRYSQLQRTLAIRYIWVGSMDSAESANTVERALGNRATISQTGQIAAMSGGVPSLVDALVEWWEIGPNSAEITPDPHVAYEHPSVRMALMLLWDGLYYNERSILHDLITLKPKQQARFVKQNRRVLQGLIRRGILRDTIASLELCTQLLAQWIIEMRHTIRGSVWFNETNDTFYQGERALETLTPRAEAALDFFLQHPYKKCEKDVLIEHIWETTFVSDDSVYQVIRELRRFLEPNSKKPCYLLNHRSLRGGRYQFFPEGRGEPLR